MRDFCEMHVGRRDAWPRLLSPCNTCMHEACTQYGADMEGPDMEGPDKVCRAG